MGRSHRAALWTLLFVVAIGVHAGAQNVVLRVSGLDPENEVAAQLIELFEARHPGIDVQAAPLPPSAPGTNWEIELSVQFVAGSAPDVIAAYGSKLYDWAEMGFLQDLAPLAVRDGVDLSLFEQEALRQYTIDGALYALPSGVSTSVIYYNKDMFLEAGLPFPGDNWTWDDLREYAVRLTVRTESGVQRYGLAFQGTLLYFNPWLRAAGGIFFDPADKRRILLDQPEAFEALEFIAGMVRDEILLVEGAWWGPFHEQQYAMLYDGSWLLPHFLRLPVPFELGVAPMPIGPADRVAFLNSSSYVINAQTDVLDAAWQFVRFMTSEEVLRLQLEADPGGIPALSTLWPEWVSRFAWEFPQGRELSNVVVDAFNNYTVTEPFFLNNQETRAQIDAALMAVWRGAKPVPIAMEELVSALNAQLSNL